MMDDFNGKGAEEEDCTEMKTSKKKKKKKKGLMDKTMAADAIE